MNATELELAQLRAAEHSDRELLALLVCLAPMPRALAFVDPYRREFDSDGALAQPYSSGERALIAVAAALWSGSETKLDLSYIVCLGQEFFDAVMGAIAVYRGQDIGPYAADPTIDRELDARVAR